MHIDEKVPGEPMKKLKENFTEDSGVTLIELLAAITILSIIVTAFLVFFVQAGRTNNMTTSTNEATFLAQEEMERVTYLSSQGVTADDVGDPENKNEYTLSTSIDFDSESDLYKVVVTVTGGEKGNAKMETRLPFAEE